MFVLALVGCANEDSPGDEPKPDETGAREAISQAMRSFEKAWKSGDPTASAARFTEDTINMRPGEESDIGRAAVQKVFENFLSSVTINEVAFTTQELDVHGDTAYELGNFFQQFTEGESEVTRRSRYMVVWKLESDGQWRFHRFHFNNVPNN